MRPDSKAQDWRIAEALVQPRQAFILFAVYRELWSRPEDFAREFGAELSADALFRELEERGLLQRTNDVFVLTELGREAASRLQEGGRIVYSSGSDRATGGSHRYTRGGTVMVISIVNHTNGQVSDEEVQTVIRAINRQIQEDFVPYWSMTATLRLEGRSVAQPEKVQMSDLRGDAIIYLWDRVDIPNAIGYHFQNTQGIPFGFVFTDVARQLGEDWSVTLSHEALELLGDPETNLLVMGPHPTEDRDVFHWFEMCDAVQSETYQIDGVNVSNFLLPLYFTGTRDVDEVGARNDYLTRVHGRRTLGSFGINPGGYIGFYDPETRRHETFAIRGDRVAEDRLRIKAQGQITRRSVRYRDPEAREKLRAVAAAEGTAHTVRRGAPLAAAAPAPAPAPAKGDYAPILPG